MAKIFRFLRRAAALQIVRSRNQIVMLHTQYSGMNAGVRQAADAENQVGRFAVRIDKIIGQRQRNLHLWIARRQPRQPRRDMALAKIDRGVDPHQSTRLKTTVLQVAPGNAEPFAEPSGMFGKQASRFGGNHRPGITIKELLAERILKLVKIDGRRVIALLFIIVALILIATS